MTNEQIRLQCLAMANGNSDGEDIVELAERLYAFVSKGSVEDAELEKKVSGMIREQLVRYKICDPLGNPWRDPSSSI